MSEQEITQEHINTLVYIAQGVRCMRPVDVGGDAHQCPFCYQVAFNDGDIEHYANCTYVEAKRLMDELYPEEHEVSEQKHDGKLDEGGKMRVRLTGDDGEEFRGKRQVVIMDEAYDGFGLSPAQFLSLMEWGAQNREKLEQLAQEEDQQ